MATTKINEVGNRYGLLTVLKECPQYRGTGAHWLCRCDCGTEVILRGIQLRHGSVRSCGCLRDMSLEERKARGIMPHGKERVIVTREEA